MARSAESLSPRLVESIVRLGTWMPFERVPAELAFFTGVVIDVDTARRLTEQAGAALVRLELAEVERLEREQPEAPAGPAVQQLSADGAMVPLVRGEWAEVKTVAVGTVSQERPPTGAVGGHTHDISDCSRLADHETFGRLALGELHRRGTPTAGVVVGVMDGSEWLQGFLDLHRPDAVRILDFPHAVEHLAAAAQASFGSGTLLATTWLEDQRHTLRHGEVAEVLAAVCRLPTPLATDPVHAEVVRDQTLTYLVKRWEQIQYAVFAQQGYPLGSGMVESANKLVVEARLKGSGMHWARVNVNPLVALRAMVCRDRWEASWPRIGRQLREQSATRRRQRRAAKTVAATVVPSATPVLQQPAPPGVDPPVVALRRVPTIVNGRPTARHPWKRPLLAAGRHHNAAHAKS
ncbi:MAG: ISKra4-like element ISKra2 family transposase [Dehalococcoidia bacterium]